MIDKEIPPGHGLYITRVSLMHTYLPEGVILCQNGVIYGRVISFHQVHSMPCQSVDEGPECTSFQRL